MTEEQFYTSLRTNKLCLSFWGKATHFGFVLFLLSIPVMFSAVILYLSLTKTPTQRFYEADTIPIFSLFIIVPIFLAFLSYKMQVNGLKFKEIYTTLSRQQLNDIIEKIGQELKWYPKEINEHFIIAATKMSLFSWGEQITILFDSNRILINSICDPDKRSSIGAFGRNRKNVNRLVEEIEKANENFLTK